MDYVTQDDLETLGRIGWTKILVPKPKHHKSKKVGQTSIC